MAAPTEYRACDCSDGEHVHFSTLDDLRGYVASGVDLHVPIWVDALRVPDFDDADEADFWLMVRDADDADELARERHLEHHGHGGRI